MLKKRCHFCDAKKNAEGVHHFQPRVARANALPWATSKNISNPEGVAEIFAHLVEFANSFRVHSGPSLCSPGRCPGLEFANAFGVCQSSRTDVRQSGMPLKAFLCRPYLFPSPD